MMCLPSVYLSVCLSLSMSPVKDSSQPRPGAGIERRTGALDTAATMTERWRDEPGKDSSFRPRPGASIERRSRALELVATMTERCRD